MRVPFSGSATQARKLPALSGNGRDLYLARRHVDADIWVTLNVDDLRAGDVMLFGANASTDALGKLKHDAGSLATVATQLSLGLGDAARWVHVGVLDGEFNVWDAMPTQNVRCRPLREVLGEAREIAIFRPATIIEPSALLSSLSELSNNQYRMFKVQTGGRFFNRLAGTGLSNAPPLDEKDVICSSFVANILRRSTRHPFFADLLQIAPGDFAMNGEFAEVALAWRRLA